MNVIQDLAAKLGQHVINPILFLLFGAGMLLFVWGLVEYLYALNVKGEQEATGKSHMFWGMVGMFVMAAALTIIKLINSTVGGRLPPGY